MRGAGSACAPVHLYERIEEMSEETKVTSEATTNFALPPVEFPKVEMPQEPETGAPKGDIHMSCEGDIPAQFPAVSPVPPPQDGIPRILIGIPCLNFSYEFVTSFLKFWTSICTMAKGKFTAGYYFVYRRPVHMAEIEIVKVAQFNKCTHILFMDDDIYNVTVDDLEKLLAADKDVIGGVMYASKFPYAMCVFRRYDRSKKVIDMPADNSMYRLYEIPCLCKKCNSGLSHWDAKFCMVCGEPQDQLIQTADLIPFAFTLMKTSIFDKIKKPWFHCTEGYPSDSWFADRCIEAGIQEYAHMAVRLTHNGVNDLTRPHYMNMGLEEKRKTGVGMVTLSQEEMDKHQFMLHNKMLDAEAGLKTKVEMVEVGEEIPTGGVK